MPLPGAGHCRESSGEQARERASVLHARERHALERAEASTAASHCREPTGELARNVSLRELYEMRDRTFRSAR